MDWAGVGLRVDMNSDLDELDEIDKDERNWERRPLSARIVFHFFFTAQIASRQI